MGHAASRLSPLETFAVRRMVVRLAVVLMGWWCAHASAIDRPTAVRIQAEIAAHARAKGETAEEFASRMGSPLWHIERFVFDAEENGGTAEEALGRLERFVEALRDPNKRQLLKCLGIRVPQDGDPPPTRIDCAVLKRKFGVP